ncbi:MAG TPA: type I polyketide synthase, partial [Blastocatellia bacterium]|nr:type I polyketide synthase [Blastocatellia bacterium]
GYWYQEEGILSPDGHCRPFDAEAKGTIGGDGVGVVVLKRLADAVADGDHIFAAIKGSAVNNDGALKLGYTAPSVDGQAGAVSEALSVAGFGPETVSYIETHGTGTVLGDPVEIAALNKVYGAGAAGRGSCAIGSVKANIGHVDAAAGAAGLIKTALALKFGLLPPSINFRRPNPKIDFDHGPFYVNRELTEWRPRGGPRRAGVSSFGVGGTNAHVVLEEPPAGGRPAAARPAQLLVLSAKSQAALEATAANLARHFRQNPETDLADAAYTLQVGRKAFGHRRALVCRNLEEAARALEGDDPQRAASSEPPRAGRPVVFMFPGQGAQTVRMALDLYRGERLFREEVDRCSRLLEPELGFDLRQVLFPTDEESGAAAERLKQTAVTQPALFVIEYALAKLWIAWGVRPQTMIGHSIGEYTAACLAGVFTIEEALRLVAARGRLMQQLPPGGMLSIPLPEAEVRPLLSAGLSLAAVNAPALCVASGPATDIEALADLLAGRGVETQRLHTSHAFHSGMMDPILGPFSEEVRRLELKPPTIPYVSNVSGTWVTTAEATDPDYWCRHLRHTVRFADGVRELMKADDRVLLEVGPGQVLSSLARQQQEKGAGRIIVPSLARARDSVSDAEQLMSAAGRLWLAGVAVEWPGLHADGSGRRVPLPTYPFERQRFWVNSPGPDAARPRLEPLGKRPDMADWFYVPSWKRAMPPGPVAPQGPLSELSCWVVLHDGSGVGPELVGRLEALGQEVISVIAGEKFSQTGDCAYTLCPGRENDYNALLSRLLDEGKIPQQVFHLWGVTPAGAWPATEKPLERALDRNFFSLLLLAQALGRRSLPGAVKVGVVTSGLHEVTGEEQLHPEVALSLGPCRVIPKEYPNISCRNIDIAGLGAR